jgi:hypothetical protein
MLFWIFAAIPVLIIALAVLAASISRDLEVFAVGLLIAGISGVAWGPAVFIPWADQANDMGTLEAQDKVIAVYQEQVINLQTELQSFHYAPGALLNADSPVAAVVKSLTDVQGQLTDAQTKKAQAMVNIEQRRHGPFSGVIWLVGDYKH